MLELLITTLALAAVCFLVWLGSRKSKAFQKLSGQMSGPLEQMQDQILLTADTAVDRLDAKIAQMEILLAEIDRRSTLLAQQSQQQQLQQLQLEQQQQQFKEWLRATSKKFEQDFESKATLLQNFRQNSPLQHLPVEFSSSANSNAMGRITEKTPVSENSRSAAMPRQNPDSVAEADGVKQRQSLRNEIIKESSQPMESATDKRTKIFQLAEQGWAEGDIAQKMGIGKGEVMLLLKLRKKATS